MLDNAFDPNENKYVKKIWAYKITKIGREKRDLVWEYFRHRKTVPAVSMYKKYNLMKLMFNYFSDPVQRFKDLRTDEQQKKDIEKIEWGKKRTKEKKIIRDKRVQEHHLEQLEDRLKKLKKKKNKVAKEEPEKLSKIEHHMEKLEKRIAEEKVIIEEERTNNYPLFDLVSSPGTEEELVKEAEEEAVEKEAAGEAFEEEAADEKVIE